MPTPGIGGEEGAKVIKRLDGTSLLKRLGRASQFFQKGKFRAGVKDLMKPRKGARSKRGDFRSGRRAVQNTLGGPPSVL
jgi:hypothetical protein